MPKVVDRGARRLTIADAALRLAARDGLEAVSIRAVAAEAGMSAGAVQKYFATKDELLLCALDLSDERLVRRWHELPDDAPLAEYLRQVLPLDDPRRAENALLWSFTARAAYLPEWAERIAGSYAELHERVVMTLEPAVRHPAAENETTENDATGPAGRPPAGGMSTGELAHTIIALTDGFAHRMMQHPLGAPELDTLLQALESAVDTLLTATLSD